MYLAYRSRHEPIDPTNAAHFLGRMRASTDLSAKFRVSGACRSGLTHQQIEAMVWTAYNERYLSSTDDRRIGCIFTRAAACERHG